jgi:hypothetical protein
MADAYISKGSHIRAHWFQVTKPLSSLAGMQMKFGAHEVTVTGICRHFRGDDPVNPTKIKVYIDPDPGTWDGPTVRPEGCTCDHEHVEINPDHIVGMV